MLPKHVEKERFCIMRLKILLSIEQKDENNLDTHKTQCEPEIIIYGMKQHDQVRTSFIQKLLLI